MKRAGQWFGSDVFDSFRAEGSGQANANVNVNTNANDAVAAGMNGANGADARGALIAAQVASKIQGYWDGEAAKVEKGRVVEERRLRGVAKSVGKLVLGEWKKAVWHIREQQRLKHEAEELKRGHEHLDAILDQSGHILDVQQGDLTRGDGYAGRRSRSSSVSVSGRIMEWGEEEDEDEEDDEEQEGDTGEQEGEEGEQEDAVEGDGEEGTEDVVMKPPEAEEEEGEGDDSISRTTKSEAGDDEEEDPSTSALGLLGDYAAEPQTPGSTTSALPDPSTPASESLADRSLEQSVRDDMEEDEEEDDAAVEDMMRAQVFSSPIQPRRARESTEGVDEDQDLATPDDQDTDAVDRDPSQPPSTRAGSQTPAEESTAALVDLSPSVAPDDVLVTVPTDPADPVDSQPAARKEEEEEDTDVDQSEDDRPSTPEIPAYLLPYAVAPVEWDATKRVTPPLLLRGFLRPYQQSGLEWLASLHLNNLNGILADEMGLGKTIQTIALLAHLACDRGIWGPHLIIVPTSVLLNWEMEFKKFLPGFKVLSYHGSTKRRKDLRQGWNERHHFNVCITSYTLASRDAIIFKRKPWYYMILDEAHMIKNFKSQRWNTLLMFRSFRRLLLTGTPLQNNLTELWALLQFLMSGSDFVNLKEFGEWFSNPLERAIEAGSALDEDTMQRVTKLHTVLRPYLLRRLKRDVEKELPSKYEHLVLCPLSKRQRFLYDEFMSRAHTRDALQSGVYQKIANILMQLRKVCNHPDLFEVRPIVTSFAIERSAVADFEIKELLLRRRLQNDEEETVNLDLFGFRFIDRQGSSLLAALETRRLDGTTCLPFISEIPGVAPPKDTRTIAGFRAYSAYQQRAATISRWAHIGYLNRLRCNSFPIYSSETLSVVQQLHHPLLPLSAVDTRSQYLDSVYLVNAAIKSYATRADEMAGVVDRFAFVTPAVIARDLPRIALAGHADLPTPPGFDDVLHRASVKLQIAFPDPSLLQYDCGKLQQLTELLREKKAGGHRILIFTQMTKILDILEIYLNFHGYLYLRLDGATRIEDRQYITERFNADPRVFCFIASSRSGGVGINLTGADTVVFYDSDFNPQMDRQCEDRAHRIGQIRDVHIYRFVSQHTVEEAMLRKANQKRSLDDLVIQKGEFDWRSLFGEDSALLTRALGEFEDREDAHAAAVAAREEVVLEGQDKADFLDPADGEPGATGVGATGMAPAAAGDPGPVTNGVVDEPEPEEPEPEEEGGTVADYMIAFVQRDPEYFREWKL
ncbi:SNF2 family N-terminal domain-containing protein [Mycena metata]|uniref:Helicase SWR1 n=1 Tax=Mycena metata TaxID=1033252 RepID=A0AAD7HJP0_9AGAR|nr:SNF2 family N-terminal domain-containing protein [Mycena metata]